MRAAIRLGLIAALNDGTALRAPALLMAALRRSGVAAADDGTLALSAPFRVVWAARGAYLRARLDFLALALRDLLAEGDALMADMPRFMARSETFSLFRYDRARRETAEDVAHTRIWFDYVTARTTWEARLLAPAIAFDGPAAMLEIGGNSGAFALALLADNPGLRATVLDLPVVCALGREWTQGRPHAERLLFLPGDAFADEWPGPVDAVLFKSVLHDWPEAETAQLLNRAAAALAPGGRIIICERERIDLVAEPPSFLLAEEIVFAPFFRPAVAYEAALAAGGLVVSSRRPVPSLPFMLVEGARRGAVAP